MTLLLILSPVAAFADIDVLALIDQGRYWPGFFDQSGFASVGQGQAGWNTFDIRNLAGKQVGAVRYAFTQVDTQNAEYFPLSIAMYDVATPYSLLRTDRIPIDATGEAIAADLHSGNIYATFTVFAATLGAGFDISLGLAAIGDLQAKIDAGEQYFSVGLANTSFEAMGYFTPGDARLIVSSAPEPASLLLLATSLGLCLLNFRRQVASRLFRE